MTISVTDVRTATLTKDDLKAAIIAYLQANHQTPAVDAVVRMSVDATAFTNAAGSVPVSTVTWTPGG